MKKAHKYKLEVKWSNRKSWDVDILAINAEVVKMFLHNETENDFIINVNISLIERNVSNERDSFLAKVLDK